MIRIQEDKKRKPEGREDVAEFASRLISGNRYQKTLKTEDVEAVVDKGKLKIQGVESDVAARAPSVARKGLAKTSFFAEGDDGSKGLQLVEKKDYCVSVFKTAGSPSSDAAGIATKPGVDVPTLKVQEYNTAGCEALLFGSYSDFSALRDEHEEALTLLLGNLDLDPDIIGLTLTGEDSGL